MRKISKSEPIVITARKQWNNNGKRNAPLGGWKPGQSGNPKGRPVKSYSLSQALRDRIDKRQNTLERIADRLLEMALAGDLGAIKLIWTYVDGLPKQMVEVTSSENDDAIERLAALTTEIANSIKERLKKEKSATVLS